MFKAPSTLSMTSKKKEKEYEYIADSIGMIGSRKCLTFSSLKMIKICDINIKEKLEKKTCPYTNLVWEGHKHKKSTILQICKCVRMSNTITVHYRSENTMWYANWYQWPKCSMQTINFKLVTLICVVFHETHSHLTRACSQGNLVPSWCKNNSNKRKFTYRRSTSFNDLPTTAKSLLPSSIGDFKHILSQ